MLSSAIEQNGSSLAGCQSCIVNWKPGIGVPRAAEGLVTAFSLLPGELIDQRQADWTNKSLTKHHNSPNQTITSCGSQIKQESKVAVNEA